MPVRYVQATVSAKEGSSLTCLCLAATYPSHPRQASEEGREGALRKDGREDAQEACREIKAQGEEKQGSELVREDALTGVLEFGII